jgi:hypothetical protein
VRTDLLVFGGPAPVPPCCWRPPAPLPRWQVVAADTAVIELPALVPREPASRIVPALSVLSDRDYSFRFEATAGDGRGWISLSPVGPHAGPPLDGPEADSGGGSALPARAVAGSRPAPGGPAPAGGSASTLTPDIDQYRVSPPARHVRLRVRIHGADLEAVTRAPTLLAISLSNDDASSSAEIAAAPGDAPRPPVAREPQGLGEAPMVARAALPVHALSQMEAPEALRHRICSPTSVAMVLRYWERAATPLELAEEMYDRRRDLYGVWPAAIRAAARRGIHGYLLRFPSWAAAAWCLDHGLPIIASVRYAEGELRGAAIGSTRGHLLVLRGHQDETVLVNDPAAPTAAEVPRPYALADLRRVWLERSGVGYVLFDPRAVERAGPRIRRAGDR